MESKTVIFDLDDTLYNEVGYLRSAYKEISVFLSKHLNDEHQQEFANNLMYTAYQSGNDAFDQVLKHYQVDDISKSDLLEMYRNHSPIIELHPGAGELLEKLTLNGNNLGLITDGRSIQQRSKIKALGIEKYFSAIVISEEFGSEKPNLNNFKFFERQFPNSKYFYIADNPKKDFVAPKKMGWVTICLLDNGSNIHKQNFDVSSEFLPDFYVKEIRDILDII